MNVHLKIKEQFFTKKSLVLAIRKKFEKFYCQKKIYIEKIYFKLKIPPTQIHHIPKTKAVFESA